MAVLLALVPSRPGEDDASAASPSVLPPSWPPPGAALYLGCIHALAAELGRPFDEVARLYCADLQRVAAGALVFDYLPVLVSKHLRLLYMRKQTSSAEGGGEDGGQH